MNVIRGKLNKLLEHKAFYIVFAIIASIVLWTYVAYVENPDVSVTISGIPVDFINEDVLEENHLVLTSVGRETVSLSFTGKRNNVTKLNDSNLSLSVDLADILKLGGIPGSYPLSYTIQYPSKVNRNAISVSGSNASYITATVENLVTAEVPVRCNYDGDVAEGFKAEPIEFSPQTISVSGPEALVGSVEYAWANVHRDVISATLETQTGVVLMDISGNPITSDRLTLSTDSVNVRIPVAVVKDVALDVKLIYSASATEDNVTYTVTPSTVTLSGEAEVLNDVNTLVIKTINLNDILTTSTEAVDIPLPNAVENVSGVTTAVVTIQVLGTETAKVTATEFSTKNDTPGYISTVVTQSLDVTLRGLGSSAKEVQPENIRVVADMAELGSGEGTFTVPAVVTVDGTTTVDVIGAYTVTVIVTKE